MARGRTLPSLHVGVSSLWFPTKRIGSLRKFSLWGTHDELHTIGGNGETHATGRRIKRWIDNGQCLNKLIEKSSSLLTEIVGAGLSQEITLRLLIYAERSDLN